ncbi:MAG: hypothetical protein Q4G25_05785 [Paracoccus sp. (in: a-proteobacteria)]|nr:hypothetical protein [Paracoccus sp. (in: a-proteobacteria)]
MSGCRQITRAASARLGQRADRGILVVVLPATDALLQRNGTCRRNG